MNKKLRQRIYNYALKNRHRPVWKRRLLALSYGASLIVISRIKEVTTNET